MSKRLWAKLRFLADTGGNAEKARLADAGGRSVRTLERWIATGSIPSAQIAYKLAVACGFTKEEAAEMMHEATPEAAKETA